MRDPVKHEEDMEYISDVVYSVLRGLGVDYACSLDELQNILGYVSWSLCDLDDDPRACFNAYIEKLMTWEEAVNKS